jgi:hypothetical protein
MTNDSISSCCGKGIEFVEQMKAYGFFKVGRVACIYSLLANYVPGRKVICFFVFPAKLLDCYILQGCYLNVTLLYVQ